MRDDAANSFSDRGYRVRVLAGICRR